MFVASFLALLVSVTASSRLATARGSNRQVSAAKIPVPVIHRGARRCQPNPQELAIFQRITPLYLGIKGRRPQPAGRSKLGRSRNGRSTQTVAAVNVFPELHHPIRPGP